MWGRPPLKAYITFSTVVTSSEQSPWDEEDEEAVEETPAGSGDDGDEGAGGK